MSAQTDYPIPGSVWTYFGSTLGENWAAPTGGGGGISEAPQDSFFYGRSMASWQRVLSLTGGEISGSLKVDGTTTLAAATATTPATSDNSTAVATTAFIKAQGYQNGNQPVTLSGDVTGSGPTAISATVTGLQGRALSATAPTANQVLQWNGSAWTPTTAAGSGTVTSITAGTGLTGGTITASGTIALSTPVSVANGGTGASTAAAALTSLGAAPIASPTFTGTVTIPPAASIATPNISGVTNGSSALAGTVGEYLSASGGPFGAVNNTWQTPVTLALGAGDWDVWGWVNLNATSGNFSQAVYGFGNVGNSAPTYPPQNQLYLQTASLITLENPVGPVRISSSVGLTVYLNTYIGGITGVAQTSGIIQARRVR